MRCSLPDCERKHHARGLCHVHYKRAGRARSLENRPTRDWTSRPSSPGWREVPGSLGRYLVNTQGQVYSRWQDRLLQGRPVGSGHIRVYLRLPGGPRGRYVHQLVMEAFVGPRPAGMDTRHLDGNPANNALANLAYGTPSENARDRRRHGTDANARKAACKHGHPFDETNTHIRPDGSRQCRTCARERARLNARADRLAAEGGADRG